MLNITSLNVQNCLMWQNAHFAFEPGTTVVGGDNQAGKSLLFKSMRLAIWGALAGRRGTDEAKLPEGARIGVAFGTGKKLWRIEATRSKVSLSRGDKSLKMSGKMAALDRLLKTSAATGAPLSPADGIRIPRVPPPLRGFSCSISFSDAASDWAGAGVGKPMARAAIRTARPVRDE